MNTQASDAQVMQSANAHRFIAHRRPEPFKQSCAVYDTTEEPKLLVYYADDEQDAKRTAERWNAGKMRDADRRRIESIKTLRQMLKPGDTVYTILRHVSRSGMNRRISLVVGSENGSVTDISWDASHAMGDPIKNRAGYVQDVGIEVSGCGMDMGFSLVYNLSRTLFPEGFMCAGEHCGSNDHCNRVKPPEGTCIEHAQRKPKGNCTNLSCKPWIHSGDGGYALLHRWL